MSVKLMTYVWEGFPGSGSELLMMLALADRADDDQGRLWPSIMTLAKKCRVSESMARRLIRNLEAKGYVTVIGNHNGGKPGTTRHYELNVSRLRSESALDLGHITAKPKVPPKPKDASDPQSGMDATPGMDARYGSHGCTSTPGMDATQYIQEHSSVIRKEDGEPRGSLSDHAQATDLFSSNEIDPSSSSSSNGCTSAGDSADATRTHSSAVSKAEASGSKSAADVGSEAKKGSKSKRAKTVPDLSMVVVPDWLDRGAWDSFVEFRASGKWPMSVIAAKGIIAELGRIRGKGGDPVASIEKSIRSDYRDVFYVKPEGSTENFNRKFTGHGSNQSRQSPQDQWDQLNRARGMHTEQDYFDGVTIDG